MATTTMNLGFDAKRVFHNETGLGNYSRQVLQVLSRHAPEHRLFAYNPRPGRVATDLGPSVTVRGPHSVLGRALPSLWRTRSVVADLARDEIALFHGLSAELPLGIERTAVASVVTIHDLIFERFPELYSSIDRRIYAWKARSAVARADLVIAVSEQTRRDLVELYGVAPERIAVVYQGCRPVFHEPADAAALGAARERLWLPASFLLSVGTIEPRKNLLLVLRAMTGLPDAQLVVVSPRTAYAAQVDAFVEANGLKERVRFLSGIGADELALVYKLATAFVYPSFYEGFGIPILEALSSGVPVVTTRGGVFGEVGGPGSAYVDPKDSDELRGVLASIMSDAARRASMREAGLAHAARFGEVAIARNLLAAYTRAIANRLRP